nr:hypothetical protein [Bradyrhizobium cenepequi]
MVFLAYLNGIRTISRWSAGKRAEHTLDP